MKWYMISNWEKKEIPDICFMPIEIKKTDFIQSLEKGLRVISVFDHSHTALTLTEVAKLENLTRANARRILLTLQYLGYVHSEDGKLFSLTPKVLSLGYSYLSSLPFREIAQPFMQTLAKEVNESCSMSVLEESSIVYIARVHTKRIMTISLGIGTRLPAHATSMGKVIMADLSEKKLEEQLEKLSFESFTPQTIRNKTEMKKALKEVQEKGWAVADQELELGVRSIACPIRDQHGKTVAALNISGHAGRVSLEEMLRQFLPKLQSTVAEIENALHHL